jgi:hypothetical protein
VVREKHGFEATDEPVLWRPTDAQAHNRHESTALRP